MFPRFTNMLIMERVPLVVMHFVCFCKLGQIYYQSLPWWDRGGGGGGSRDGGAVMKAASIFYTQKTTTLMSQT